MATKYTISADLTANPTAFIAGFAAAEAAMDKFNKNVVNSAKAAEASMGNIRNSARTMAGGISEADTTINRTSGRMRDLGDATDGTSSKMNATASAMRGASSGLDSIGSSADNADRKVARLGNSFNNARNYTRAFGDSVEPTIQSTRNLSNEMDNVANTSASIARGTSEGSRGMGAFSKSTALAARDLDRFNRLGRGMSMTMMGISAAIVGGIGASLYTFTQYEQALAGVAKTTNANAKEMRTFDLAFRKMARSMPAAYEEIAQVAETAAQLGVQNQNITKFTDTMIRMGTSTNLAAEDAANALSRMMNIMGTSQSDVDRFASTIVKMGNVSAATEQDIVNMGMRIAGMGKSLDMSEADVVALATSLSDLGVRAEMGGSAISTIMSKTASAIEQGTDKGQKWAEVMGMSIGKVKKLFKEDAYGGLIQMVKGLEKVKESGGNLDKTLRELGINEIRQLDVMKRLTGNSEKLAQAQKTANTEWQVNNALMQESTKRYQTFGSQVEMAWNGIKNIAANIGGAFAKSDSDAAGFILNIINNLEKLTDKFFDAEGNITRFGEKFVSTTKAIAGVSVVLGATAGAFMLFGPGGAAVVGAIGGLTLLGAAAVKIGKEFGIGADDVEKAMLEIDDSLSSATSGKAEKFLRMRDDINGAMADIRIRSTDEARKTKAEILAEVDSLTNEVINAINKKESQILAINKRLVKSATGAEKEALQASVSEIKAHYEKQRQLAADAQSTITKTLNSAYSERRKLTSSEYATISNMFSGLDKLYSTHVSKSIDEMGTLSRAFETFDKNTKFETVQKNVTSFAKETATAMSELNKGFEKQKKTLESSGLPAKELGLHLSALRREYDENRSSLLGNLDVYEESAKKLHKNVDATKGLSKEQQKLLETASSLKQEAGEYNAKLDNYGANANNVTIKTQSLSQAAKNAAKEMESSKTAANNAAQAYLNTAKNAVSLKDAFGVMKTSSKEAATAMGEGFVSSVENGIKMVDLGTAGKMKLDEFVKGVQSGKVTVEQAAVAQVNAMRARLGQGSLSPEGEKQMQSFVNGLRSGSMQLSDIANQLGLNLKSGMKVDLGDAGKVSVESFVSGLKSGQYGAVELMAFFQNTLKTASITDLTNSGSQTMQTLKAGLESGLISADAVMQGLEGRLKAGASVNLMGEGKVTLDTLVAGFESGKYSADTFMVGLQALLKANAKTDLTAEGNATIKTLENGLFTGIPGLQTQMEAVKTGIKTPLDTLNLSTQGGKAMITFGQGIQALSGVPKGNAVTASGQVEIELGKTSDGGGGKKAMSDMGAGLNEGQPLVTGFANGITTTVAGLLGMTTDGDGGKKATSKMANDIAAGGNTAKGAASGAKQGVEATLGSTNDGGGGNKAGSKFANDLANKQGASRGAANSNKTAVELMLGSANDGGGGKKAGSMFVSGVQNQSGNARSAGSSVSSSARGGLSSNSNTYGLGQDFGSGFVSGIRSFIKHAIDAAASLARAALNAVRSAQRSNSPAKETIALGGDFGDGFALAIADKSDIAAKAAKTMVNSAIGAANKANVGFDINDVVSPLNSGTINRRLSAETKQFASVELSGRQPANINVAIGGQEFRAFSENIYDANTKRLNFKNRFES